MLRSICIPQPFCTRFALLMASPPSSTTNMDVPHYRAICENFLMTPDLPSRTRSPTCRTTSWRAASWGTTSNNTRLNVSTPIAIRLGLSPIRRRNRDLRPPLRYNLIRNRIKPYPLKRKSTNMPLPRGRSTEPADSNDNRAEPDLHDIVDRPSLLRFTSLGRWGAYSAHITPRPGSALGQRTRMLAMEDQPPQHDDNNTGTFAQVTQDLDASS